MGAQIRAGGMVLDGSVRGMRDAWTSPLCSPTIEGSEFKVIYSGILPDLFREGQGIIVQGELRADGVFEATRCWPSTMRTTCHRSWPDVRRPPGTEETEP